MLACGALFTFAPMGVAQAPEAPSTRPSGSGLVRTTSLGPATVTVDVNRLELNAAQHVRLAITAEVPPGYTLAWPAAEAKLGEFSVGSRSEAPARLRAGRVSQSLTFTLEPFLPGEYTIPAMEIAYARIGSRDTGTVKTDPVAVRVVSLIPQDAPLEAGPARSVVDAPPRGARWIMPAVTGAGTLMLAAGVTAWTIRRRGARLQAPGAWEALAALRDRTQAGACSAREICDQAAPLVRRAFAARVQGALAMTTEQLLAAAPAGGITAHELDQVREFLRLCDSVRYAGDDAPPGEPAALLSAMVSIASGLERPRAGVAP
jgi:hypothetical protein